MSAVVLEATGSPAVVDDTPKALQYFDRVPQWSTAGRRFEVTADAISGRIPVTRLETWRDFAGLLEDPFFNRPGVQLVFRGHRRYDWGLMPTLARITGNGIITQALAELQLERFKRAVRGRLLDRTMVDEDDELWSVGQHHGLLTPLLDWTYSPYVALFFAFAQQDPTDGAREDAGNDNPYRAVYVLNKTFVADNDLCPDIRVCEPRKDDHGRLVNQAGLFTVSPFDATIENKLADILGADDFHDAELREADEDAQAEILARYICKIYVRNEDRDACLRQLRRMNVHHASLFPDLFGASDYCNILATEEHLEREARAAAAVPISVEPPVPAPVNEPAVIPLPETASSLTELLLAPAEAARMGLGRIRLIGQELARDIEQNRVIDWESRDFVQARLRNLVRARLRRHGYPMEAREQVANKVVELLVTNEEAASAETGGPEAAAE